MMFNLMSFLSYFLLAGFIVVAGITLLTWIRERGGENEVVEDGLSQDELLTRKLEEALVKGIERGTVKVELSLIDKEMELFGKKWKVRIERKEPKVVVVDKLQKEIMNEEGWEEVS